MTPKDQTDASAITHSAATIALAKKESAEHMHGMKECYAALHNRPLEVKAYRIDDPTAPEYAKTVHFVRHGQGFHNLMADIATANKREWTQFSQDPANPYIMPEILDAPLTEKGRQQALALQPCVRAFEYQPTLVVFSPNCRALQTGLLVWEDLIGNDNKVPFLAHELVREESGIHFCDKRRPRSRQQQEFPQIDFSLLESEEDPLFRHDRRESKLEVAERIYAFMEWLSFRKEMHVAVNSHSGWLLTLFNAVVSTECDEELKAWFQTGEMRSVKLEFIRS